MALDDFVCRHCGLCNRPIAIRSEGHCRSTNAVGRSWQDFPGPKSSLTLRPQSLLGRTEALFRYLGSLYRWLFTGIRRSVIHAPHMDAYSSARFDGNTHLSYFAGQWPGRCTHRSSIPRNLRDSVCLYIGPTCEVGRLTSGLHFLFKLFNNVTPRPGLDHLGNGFLEPFGFCLVEC